MARKPSDQPPFDKSPPAGDHAAERLKQFERAREPAPSESSPGQTRSAPRKARKTRPRQSQGASRKPAVKEKSK
jgi:hypothetical protein